MKTFLSTLAITLAFTFTAVPADAALTEGQKCAMKANLLSGKFSLCLNKADANVAKGRLSDTAAADAKCESKFRGGWDKVRTKAQEKDADNGNAEMLGADCGGAMSDAVRDSVEASALIAAGRDMTAFAVSEEDLAGDSGIQALIDQVDITSDNAAIAAAAEQAGCVAAGGTYESSVCTPAPVPDRDCFREGFCGVDGRNNGNYVGVTASSTGCSETTTGQDTYNVGAKYSIYAFPEYDHWNKWYICTSENPEMW